MTDNVQLKHEINRIKMQIYHWEKMSDEQKCKTKEQQEYDRKKAAAYRLKKKNLSKIKRKSVEIGSKSVDWRINQS